jgi:acetyl esterase/lipase
MKKTFPILLIAVTLVTSNCQSQKTDDNGLMKAPSGYMNETLLKISYGLGMLDLIETEPKIPEEILEIKNIEYKRVDTLSLRLDIYKLKNLQSPAPLLIFVHGGAWRSGKRSDYLPYLIDYAKKGYVTATVSYRLVKHAKFPAAVQDVNCAVKWLKSHADNYGFDPERIALIGGSAGGHLSMMIGYGGNEPMFNNGCDTITSSKVKVIVDLYGPTDLTTPYAIGRKEAIDFIGDSYANKPDQYLLASPKHYITPDDPPTLIFQGTIDSLVPVSQSDSLDIWLKKAGVPHEYHRLKGWPHTMDLSVKVNAYCQYYIDEFLKKHL